MKIYKFSDLLNDEKRVRKLYARYGLSLNSASRIVQYFKYLRKLEDIRKEDPETFKENFAKNRLKFYFSQFYVMELSNVVNAIEKSNSKAEIVKSKLSDLSKGTYLLSEEDVANTKARDTMFELSLFAFLRKFNLNVELCEPNPDIRLTSNNFIYNIECKRPSSMNSVEHQIKKAKKQLEKMSKKRVISTIALSLDQIFLKKVLESKEKYDVLLDSKNDTSALAFLDATIFKFLTENNFILGKIFKDKPCFVLYYISSLTGFRTALERIFQWHTQLL